jgi:hypothetical protein
MGDRRSFGIDCWTPAPQNLGNRYNRVDSYNRCMARYLRVEASPAAASSSQLPDDFKGKALG